MEHFARACNMRPPLLFYFFSNILSFASMFTGKHPTEHFPDIIVYHIRKINLIDIMLRICGMEWAKTRHQTFASFSPRFQYRHDVEANRRCTHKRIKFSNRIVHWLYYICCCFRRKCCCCCCCCYYHNSLIGSRERPIYSSSCCISYLKAYSFSSLASSFYSFAFRISVSRSRPSFLSSLSYCIRRLVECARYSSSHEPMRMVHVLVHVCVCSFKGFRTLYVKY